MIPTRTGPACRRTALAGLALVLAAFFQSAALAQEPAGESGPGAAAPVIESAPPASGTATPPAQTQPAPVPVAPTTAAPPAEAEPAPTTTTTAPAAGPTSAAPTVTDPRPAAVPGFTEEAPAPVAGAAPGGEAEPVRDEALPHDLSPWGMFMAADWVVKGVMIGLAFASLVTWTIWLAKALELAFAKSRARSGVRRLEEAQSLRAAIGEGKRPLRRGPVAALARAAEAERERSGGLSADGVKERASVALSRIEARSGRRMARGTGLLATIGSTAPFVGLFGTVWGIMNSFIGISEANTTNLAVVAPGIAEALLATAIGLVAAIPAVIIYNVFARSIAGYRAILADGSAAVLQHLSRDLDRHAASAGRSPRLAEAAE